MKLLSEISDKEAGIGPSERFDKPYRLRKAGRAVLFNGDKVALQYVAKHYYHKLPGGGVDEGETVEAALKREVQEEVGCATKVGDLVGVIIEYQDEHDILQISYCHLAHVDGDISEPSYTTEELEQGFRSLWVSLDEAIELLANDTPDNYEGKFIRMRDMVFLKRAKEMLGGR